MKKTALILLLSTALMAGVACNQNGGKEPPPKETSANKGPQTQCPVMGGEINKSLYVDAEGKRIYVCCPGCVATIKADPKKYIQKMESEGIILDASPTSENSGGAEGNQTP